jgi:hypothetical protein
LTWKGRNFPREIKYIDHDGQTTGGHPGGPRPLTTADTETRFRYSKSQ